MLLTTEVKVNWSTSNKKWYVDKGYQFSKWRDEFVVKVEDLSKGSRAFLCVKCDNCGKELTKVSIQDYRKCLHKDGTYYCHKCAVNLFSSPKLKKIKLSRSISFEQWCFDNLTKTEAEVILSRWDYSLNIDKNGNNIHPGDICYSSSGINRNGYWFKCLDNPEHESERKNLLAFTKGDSNLKCKQCNVIAFSHPHLIRYLTTKEDAYRYSMGSHEKIPMKCPDCGYGKKMAINDLRRQGFGCNKCGDGVSYPEKFLLNVLDQLQVIFETQKTFDWSYGKKYDFYINSKNIIIETHGMQHYNNKIEIFEKSFSEEQGNDNFKEMIANINGIKQYIPINCSYSELEYIKKSVLDSELSKIFDLSNINWLQCHENGCSSLVKEVCNQWNSGECSTLQIAINMKIHRSTVIKYLKKGKSLGWCDYDSKQMLKQGSHPKKVICLTTKEVFNSRLEASNKYAIDQSSISKCCKGKLKFAGKHPVTGEKLVWMCYEEYLSKREMVI